MKLLLVVMLGMASTAAALSMPEYEAMRLIPSEMLDNEQLEMEDISDNFVEIMETGASGGASASTGASAASGASGASAGTGASGPAPVEGPDGEMSVRFNVGLSPMKKEEFDSDKQAMFAAAIAEEADVLKAQVVVTAIEEHEGDESGGEAKFFLRRLLQADSILDVHFAVSKLSDKKAANVAESLGKAFDDEGEEGMAAKLTKAGLKVSGTKNNQKPEVTGGAVAKDGCADHLIKEINRLKAEGVAEKEWPDAMRSYCKGIFAKKKHLVKVSDDIISRTCERGYGIFARHPEGQRAERGTEEAQEFCYEMRHFFEHLLKGQAKGPMTHGIATSVTDINQKAPGQGALACCVPHASPGCFDKHIEKAVCTGEGTKFKKKDSFCCDTEWDLTCTENVEWFHVAGCPQPEF